MSVTICFSNVHSNIITADFLVLSLSIRTCVGFEMVVSVLFLFHAVLTCISQLVRFCIQSITCFSLHLDVFLWFERNSLKFFCGTLSMLYLFFHGWEVFWNFCWFSCDIFHFYYLLKAPGAASIYAVKHLLSVDWNCSNWLQLLFV